MISYTTRVVTKNFIKDFIGNLENVLGRRITNYELMVNGAIRDCLEEHGNISNVKIEISRLAVFGILLALSIALETANKFVTVLAYSFAVCIYFPYCYIKDRIKKVEK